MFKCEISNHQVEPHEKRRKVVTKRYPSEHENAGQIEREVNACVSCATAVKNNLLEIPARLK